MFDYMWGEDPKQKKEYEKIEADCYVPTVWSEHCIECSAPECWHNCPIYQERRDGACVRISGGISPLGYSKLGLPEGANLHFRRWAKIESPYYENVITGRKYEKLSKMMFTMTKCAVGMSKMWPSKKGHLFTDAAYSVRMRYIQRLMRYARKADALDMVIRANSKREIGLLVEIRLDGQPLYRNKVSLSPQVEDYRLSLPSLKVSGRPVIALYLEDSTEEYDIRIESLEIIESKERLSNPPGSQKVKLVIWDLDNTLWSGTLIEDGSVAIKREIVSRIKELDSKGIVNSISSKNNEEDATQILKAEGLSEYFVFPQINWDAKSVNTKKIISNMNISADTVVFVDDNPFEREEVKRAVPGITVVDVSDILNYTTNSRFEVPETEDAKNRRHMYHMMEQQIKEQQQWEGNIDEFLASCHMQMEIRPPRQDEIERCYELLQRTNQLNCSGRRLNRTEIEQICATDNFETYALICDDKFGSYGLVGFMIVQKGSVPRVTDFVLSCRVANRKIEHAALQYILNHSGAEALELRFIPTGRNKPIYQVITDLHMRETDESGIYRWDGKIDINLDRIVSVYS